jgi:hypothetical protein
VSSLAEIQIRLGNFHHAIGGFIELAAAALTIPGDPCESIVTIVHSICAPIRCPLFMRRLPHKVGRGQ